MKKIYVLLALMAILISVSAVSASENISVPDDVLEVDDSADNLENVEVSDELNQDQTDDNVIAKTDSDNVQYSSNQTKAKSNSTKAKSNPTKAKVVQVPKKAVTKNIKSTYGKKVKFNLKLLDKQGKKIVGKKVKFKIGKKVYRIKTNSKGIATLKLNYPAGKYKIYYYVGKLSGKRTYTVKNFVSLKIMKWGNTGDVSKNKLIKNNMPNNVWVKKAVAATKKGNPLIKIKGGKGKVVFITAGVHGNEISSQVAAMKLIKHLTTTPIKGTVYIIPFVNIKAITHKVRHTGVDYNRVAHKSGTISNKIVKLVAKYKCDAYGDFHTTQPNGVPGKNVVMGSKTPAKKGVALTNYIVKKTNVNKIVYRYAGEQYPGALSDNVNKKGIPGVICEVMLPHNTVTSKTVKKSYAMMNSLLKFNSVI